MKNFAVEIPGTGIVHTALCAHFSEIARYTLIYLFIHIYINV